MFSHLGRLLVRGAARVPAGHAGPGWAPSAGAAVAGAVLASAGLVHVAHGDSQPAPAVRPPPGAGTEGHSPVTGNDATAQWRLYTDMGRDLVGQARRVDGPDVTA